ncbi:MAG: branched-chain amino acid ABC transporter permease [Patescibacteria group bacterium]
MEIFPQLLANSIVAGSTYALIALGFNLIYGATKFVNMSHGAVAATGAYAVFFLTTSTGVDIWVAAVLGVCAAGIVGFFLDKTIFSPLRARKASNVTSFIASLGAFTVIQALIAVFFTSEFHTLSTGNDIYVYEIAGASITQIQFIIICAALVIFLGLALILNKTIFGKAVKAISDDEEVARVLGINTDRIIGYVFFIGSALAGVAGIFVGFDFGIQPTMGLLILLEGATASIIGGIGNIYGGFLGSFLLALVENFGIWKIPSQWKTAISFGLLLVFLIFRPKGIFKK